TMVLAGLFHLAMNVLVFCLLSFFVYAQLSPLVVLLPVVLAPLVLVTVAVSWVMASLGVYLRDIAQVAPVVSTAMFFLSSAIIPVDAVPPQYQTVFRLNPLTFFIDQARAVALWGQAPDWAGLGAYALGGLVAVFAAHAWPARPAGPPAPPARPRGPRGRARAAGARGAARGGGGGGGGGGPGGGARRPAPAPARGGGGRARAGGGPGVAVLAGVWEVA